MSEILQELMAALRYQLVEIGGFGDREVSIQGIEVREVANTVRVEIRFCSSDRPGGTYGLRWDGPVPGSAGSHEDVASWAGARWFELVEQVDSPGGLPAPSGDETVQWLE